MRRPHDCETLEDFVVYYMAKGIHFREKERERESFGIAYPL